MLLNADAHISPLSDASITVTDPTGWPGEPVISMDSIDGHLRIFFKDRDGLRQLFSAIGKYLSECGDADAEGEDEPSIQENVNVADIAAVELAEPSGEITVGTLNEAEGDALFGSPITRGEV